VEAISDREFIAGSGRRARVACDCFSNYRSWRTDGLKRSRHSRRAGVLVFLLPVLVMVGAVSYLALQTYFFSTGTLEVQAIASVQGSGPSPMNVTAKVSGVTGTTPFQRALPQGTYTVTFQSVKWFKTPDPISVSVFSGKTAFATGTYSPISVHVGLGQDGLNSTTVDALHGVTPVVWVNTSGQSVVLRVDGNAYDLFAGGTTTHVFTSAGTYAYTINGQQFQGFVNVS
jgi:hypothetical protein